MLADRFLPSPSSATLATAAKALGAVTSVKSGKDKVIPSKGRYLSQKHEFSNRWCTNCSVIDPAPPKPVVKLPPRELPSLSEGKAVASKQLDGTANEESGGRQETDNLVKTEVNEPALSLLLSEPPSQFNPSGKDPLKPRRKVDERYGRLKETDRLDNHEERRPDIPLLPTESHSQFSRTARVPRGPRLQANPEYGRLRETDKPGLPAEFLSPGKYSAETLLSYRPTTTTTEYTMPGPCNLKLSDLTLSAFHQLFCSANPTARTACPWDTVLAMYKSYVYSSFASNSAQAKLLRHVSAAYRRVCWTLLLSLDVVSLLTANLDQTTRSACYLAETSRSC